MKRTSSKHKIIILVLAWLLLSGSMLFYFFGLQDSANQNLLDSMVKDRIELVQLQAQNDSYKQGQNDLQEMATKPNQPEDFFTRDIALIKEIETLENLSKKLNVQMDLSGVAGTINNAPQAATLTPLAIIRYGLSLNGDLPRVVDFIETMENLSFVSNVTSLTISSANAGSVTANLTANFYLRK